VTKRAHWFDTNHKNDREYPLEFACQYLFNTFAKNEGK